MNGFTREYENLRIFNILRIGTNVFYSLYGNGKVDDKVQENQSVRVVFDHGNTCWFGEESNHEIHSLTIIE